MPRIHTNLEIHGLKDLRRELAAVNEKLPKELGNVNHEVAQYVISRSKGRASTPLEHRAADTLSAARNQRVSMVRLGGARNPEALGAEFGAGHDQLRNTTRGPMVGWNQFREWRGSGLDAGYFLFPTIREDTPQIIQIYLDLVDRLTRKAFPLP